MIIAAACSVSSRAPQQLLHVLPAPISTFKSTPNAGRGALAWSQKFQKALFLLLKRAVYYYAASSSPCLAALRAETSIIPAVA